MGKQVMTRVEGTEKINEKFLEKISVDVEKEVGKLPAITVGSPKQIAWAENIRRNAYMCLNNIIRQAVILGYTGTDGTPIFIDTDRYENGNEVCMNGEKYNSKKIVEAVHEVKNRFLDKYFLQKCTTAPQIIDNQYRVCDREMYSYVKYCYDHMA